MTPDQRKEYAARVGGEMVGMLTAVHNGIHLAPLLEDLNRETLEDVLRCAVGVLYASCREKAVIADTSVDVILRAMGAAAQQPRGLDSQ